MKEFDFETLDVYKEANAIGVKVWDLVAAWKYFERDTLGKQLIRSADSISLNICEGNGRFFYADKKLFYYYARGSLYETFEGLKKANQRNLIATTEFDELSIRIRNFAISLNNFIGSVGKNASKGKPQVSTNGSCLPQNNSSQ